MEHNEKPVPFSPKGKTGTTPRRRHRNFAAKPEASVDFAQTMQNSAAPTVRKNERPAPARKPAPKNSQAQQGQSNNSPAQPRERTPRPRQAMPQQPAAPQPHRMPEPPMPAANRRNARPQPQPEQAVSRPQNRPQPARRPPVQEPEPGLLLISRRPPKVKFANFDAYLEARGGVTVPVEGPEPGPLVLPEKPSVPQE